MAQLSQWLMRGAIALAIVVSLAAVSGCASNGAPSDQQNKEWDPPPGWVPFSA